jgi:hypothetical protein
MYIVWKLFDILKVPRYRPLIFWTGSRYFIGHLESGSERVTPSHPDDRDDLGRPIKYAQFPLVDGD